MGGMKVTEDKSAPDQTAQYRGLAVLHWAAYDEPGWDHPVFERIIRTSGTPALEIGVGAGRLQRRYLAAGLPVEGLDASEEMLAVCRERAAEQGLAPVLHAQQVQELDLPNRYRTIYIPCGSIACLPDRQALTEAFRRCREHLEPGGVLAFNLEPIDHDYKSAAAPAEDWQPHVRLDLEAGETLRVERRMLAEDAVEQSWTEERRYTLLRGEAVLAGPQVRPATLHWYHAHEVLALLRLAGFTSVELTEADLCTPYRGAYDRGPVIVTATTG